MITRRDVSPHPASMRARARAALVAVVLTAVVAAACGNNAPARPKWTVPPPPPEQRQAKWGLSWADEFDGATIDAANWVIVEGAANVNNELEHYTPTEAYLEGGSLVLRSRMQSLGGRSYTSAEVRTGTKHTVTYGSAVEWRTQIPSGKGIWPANWLVNSSCDGLGGCGGNWPPEIDVLEVRGSAPAINVMTHWWDVWPNQKHETSTWTAPSSLADAYHVYRLEWYRDSIIWLVDGVQRAKHTQNITRGNLQLVMNTAVGGDFDGPPDGTTVFPQYHRIDYVRVYRDTANTY